MSLEDGRLRLSHAIYFCKLFILLTTNTKKQLRVALLTGLQDSFSMLTKRVKYFLCLWTIFGSLDLLIVMPTGGAGLGHNGVVGDSDLKLSNVSRCNRLKHY